MWNPLMAWHHSLLWSHTNQHFFPKTSEAIQKLQLWNSMQWRILPQGKLMHQSLNLRNKIKYKIKIILNEEMLISSVVWFNLHRYAVVTGANKGIGLETVRQLANGGATVVLTARDEKRGIEATRLLHESGFSNVVFHQLDVRSAESIETLANFIATQFQRLDILVCS